MTSNEVTPAESTAAGPSTPERRSRWSLIRTAGGVMKLAVAALAVVVLVMVVGLVTGFTHFSNPFGSKTTDRSQPPVLLSIQNLARFQAATGNFQVVVDVKSDKSHIPDFLYSQRSLFVAAGTVSAYVDFSHLGPSSVVTSADRRTATISLPAPALEAPSIDPAHSYVYAEQKGLANRLEDLVKSDPGQENQLYQLADQKIAAAAAASGLVQRAQTNTTAMLIGMLKGLGFTTVHVTYPAARSSS